MTNATKIELINRIKSLAWRTAAFAGVGAAAILLNPEILNGIGLPVYIVAGVSLVLGEITKALNNYLNR